MALPEKKISIKPSDVVSGSLYLKLIADYKQYDNERKKYIDSLLNQIVSLNKKLESKNQQIKTFLACKQMEPEFVPKLQYKLYKRRLFIQKLREKIKTLNHQNENLKNQIIKLQMEKNSNNCIKD